MQLNWEEHFEAAQRKFGARIIAEHCLSEHDIQPFITQSGGMGVHFMNLDTSIDSETTLLSNMHDMVNAVKNVKTGEIRYDKMLHDWQQTLRESLAVIEAALAVAVGKPD